MVCIQPQVTRVGHVLTYVQTHPYGAAGELGLGSWGPWASGPQSSFLVQEEGRRRQLKVLC